MLRVLAILLLLAPPALASGTLAPGEPLTADLVERLAREALADEVAQDAAIEITAPALPLENKAGRPATVTLDGFGFDAETGRFDGDILVVLDSGETGRLRLTGRSLELVEVAVPRRTIERGTVIRADDLLTKRLPTRRLGQGIVADVDGLVGTQARRRLVAGRPVAARDLDRPILVRKGQTVTMEFVHGDLRVTTLGQALEAGGAGDQLRVVNPQTREVRHALVTGPRTVRVAAAGSPSP